MSDAFLLFGRTENFEVDTQWHPKIVLATSHCRHPKTHSVTRLDAGRSVSAIFRRWFGESMRKRLDAANPDNGINQIETV